MVDEAQALRAAGGDRHVERLDRQARFEMIGEQAAVRADADVELIGEG